MPVKILAADQGAQQRGAGRVADVEDVDCPPCPPRRQNCRRPPPWCRARGCSPRPRASAGRAGTSGNRPGACRSPCRRPTASVVGLTAKLARHRQSDGQAPLSARRRQRLGRAGRSRSRRWHRARRASPVVGNDPRSTWITELAARDRHRHRADVKTTLPVGSVTVYRAESDRGSLTATWSVAVTSTDRPGLSKGRVGGDRRDGERLVVQLERAGRAQSDVGRPFGRRRHGEVGRVRASSPVSERLSVTPPAPPSVWPGWRVTEVSLKLPVTPAGRPETLRSYVVAVVPVF